MKRSADTSEEVAKMAKVEEVGLEKVAENLTFASMGGKMQFLQAGIDCMTETILRGEKPEDLPTLLSDLVRLSKQFGINARQFIVEMEK